MKDTPSIPKQPAISLKYFKKIDGEELACKVKNFFGFYILAPMLRLDWLVLHELGE